MPAQPPEPSSLATHAPENKDQLAGQQISSQSHPHQNPISQLPGSSAANVAGVFPDAGLLQSMNSTSEESDSETENELGMLHN